MSEPSRRPVSRPLVLVTGASSGIGRELARLFADAGYDLVICAEDAGIEEVGAELSDKGGSVEVVRADLATCEGVEQLAARFGADRRAPDAIVLNAGVGLGRGFLDQDIGRILEVINLNIAGTVHLAHRLLPAMVSRGNGQVMITSSVAARVPGSYQAVYNASKAFLQSFAEAIRDELRNTGVTVTALQPGPTDTNFFHRADMDDTKLAQDDKASAADVAREGYEAMLVGKDHVIAGSLKVKAQAVIAQITPETLKAEQHRRLAEPGSANE